MEVDQETLDELRGVTSRSFQCSSKDASSECDSSEPEYEDEQIETLNNMSHDVQAPSMSMDEIKVHLSRQGYVVVPNVLNTEEIEEYKTEFFKWCNTTPGLKDFHKRTATNGILKFYEVAHQRFAWLARTNPKIIDIFGYIPTSHLRRSEDIVFNRS